MGRYDEMPPARFAVSVDHQLKRSFESREAAEREARRILDRYPHLNVRVEDRDDEGLRKPARRRASS